MKLIIMLTILFLYAGCFIKTRIVPPPKVSETKQVGTGEEDLELTEDASQKPSGLKTDTKPVRHKSSEEFCDKINDRFRTYRWNKIICNPKRWQVYGYSIEGNPLFYQKFGFDDPENTGPINVFMCGVHGDEETSIYLCFHLVREIIFDRPDVLKGFKVVVAPIVNPDGFFKGTRVNANGVDPNRNLPTKDWEEKAKKIWAKYNHDPRRNPGRYPNSEIESQFQVYLIEKFSPDKIISVHAPYGFLDFDGPSDMKYYNMVRFEKRAKFLAMNMEENSKKFLKVVNFGFFPGSLGNYAGNERKIPTYTVELPSTKIRNADHYWSSMRFALLKALSFKVYDGENGNPFTSTSRFSDTEKESFAKRENEPSDKIK